MDTDERLAADLLDYSALLSDREREALARVRRFMQTEVRPIVNDYWVAAEFPTQVVRGLARTGALAFGCRETAPFENSVLFRGLITAEIARVDAGCTTFVGVSAGLVMGAISLLGSEEHKRDWLPRLAQGDAVGAFGLTEPLHGSDVARGMETTVRREGDEWVLNGAKRWIGNATWGDLLIAWARDEADGHVKGFIVPSGTPGYTATKIEDKFSQRTVQNADIVFRDVRLPSSAHLPGANSFKDTARVLTRTRLDVAWGAVGNAIGAYEAALAYTRERTQFGKPIASFQMVQDLLVKSISAITAALGMCVRVAQLQDEGRFEDHHSAMAKAYATARAREVVAWCRELFGGNGIDLRYDVIRHFADAEAMYSFEGTREMNTLIVGRHITGISAFA